MGQRINTELDMNEAQEVLCEIERFMFNSRDQVLVAVHTHYGSECPSFDDKMRMLPPIRLVTDTKLSPVSVELRQGTIFFVFKIHYRDKSEMDPEYIGYPFGALEAIVEDFHTALYAQFKKLGVQTPSMWLSSFQAKLKGKVNLGNNLSTNIERWRSINAEVALTQEAEKKQAFYDKTAEDYGAF